LVFLEIIAEMKHPPEFPKALAVSGLFELGLYLVSACICYAYSGQTQGLMINLIPKGPWLRLAAFLLSLHMIVIYLVAANVLSRAIHRVISVETLNTPQGRMVWLFATGIVLLTCIGIANTFPFFDPLIGLVGAFVPISCWILPIIYYYLCFRPDIRTHEIPLLIIIFVLGIFLAISGIVSNMKKFVENWTTYGVPWSCTKLSDV